VKSYSYKDKKEFLNRTSFRKENKEGKINEYPAGKTSKKMYVSFSFKDIFLKSMFFITLLCTIDNYEFIYINSHRKYRHELKKREP